MKKIYITSAALLITLGVSAQTLTKEIEIERDVETSLPAAERISLFPDMLQPKAPQTRLRMVDVTSATNVPGMLNTLEPANGQPAFTISPYRGYASVGYFPAYNLGVSAGYAIIAKPTTSLNVWTQFNGNSYKDRYDESLKRNTVTVGADFSNLFGKSRRLDVSADFSYNAYNRPWEEVDPDHHTTAFNLNAAWSARLHSMAYYVTAGFNHFGFSGKEIGLSREALDGIGQNIIKAGAGTVYFITDKSSVVGHVDVNFVRTNHFNEFELMPGTDIPYDRFPDLISGDGKTLGLITFAPAYRYNSGVFSTSIGLKAQISTNSGKTFHIAPDIKFNVRPVSTFAASLTLGGGEHINTLAELYNINPYMSVAQGFKFSQVPFTADLNLTFGPYYGASVELFGGYAAANDWLMPDIANITAAHGVVPVVDRAVYGSMFETVDLRAMRYGAKFNWKFNKDIEASIKYTGAPGSYKHSYYQNRDRARHILDINASVRPFEPLTIEAGFNLRAGRSLYSHWTDESLAAGNPAYADGKATTFKYNLRNSGSLNIGATYRIFDWLSVYARVENILGRQAYLFNLLEQQGVHGLIGASLKF